MNVKLGFSIVILFLLACFSCKKSSTSTTAVTPVSNAANIDSIAGTYVGITSGDSIYTYVDGTGTVKQWLQSFSWTDTLHVTSADSISITALSKYYNITYPYGDSLTAFDSVTYLQNLTLGENGYVIYNTTLLDTANNINHLIINVWYNDNKHLVTNVTLLKRQ